MGQFTRNRILKIFSEFLESFKMLTRSQAVESHEGIRKVQRLIP